MSALLDSVEVMQEFALIRRGEHPAWKGDRISNSEHFARMIGQDFEDRAEAMCVDIATNAEDFSTLTGLPLRSIFIFTLACREGIRKEKEKTP